MAEVADLIVQVFQRSPETIEIVRATIKEEAPLFSTMSLTSALISIKNEGAG